MSILFSSKKSKVQKALKKFDSSDPEVRCKGAEILEKIGPTTLQCAPDSHFVIDTLVSHTRDSNEHVRLRTLMAINSIGAKSVAIVSALKNCLNDNHLLNRIAAADNLKKLSKEAARMLPAVLKAWTLERDSLAKGIMLDATEALAENYSPSKEEASSLLLEIEGAAISLAKEKDWRRRRSPEWEKGTRFFIELSGKLGSPAAMFLSRLALAYSPQREYLLHKRTLDELAHVGLAEPKDIIELLDWVGKEREAWRPTFSGDGDFMRARRTAKILISRIGGEAIPFLRDFLKQNLTKPQTHIEEEKFKVAKEALEDLKREKYKR